MITDKLARRFRNDPLVFLKYGWPDVVVYSKQREILESVRDNDETVVVAGNMLGKDFVAGFVVVWFFLTRSPVRIVTTSVKDDHLRVLWGEIERFVQTCRFPLEWKKGGPLILNHRDIKKVVMRTGQEDPISYLRGMVSERGEGLAGHHAAHTLAVIDEASGVDRLAYTQMQTWAKRLLIFGNPMACDGFFYEAVEGGDVLATK